MSKSLMGKPSSFHGYGVLVIQGQIKRCNWHTRSSTPWRRSVEQGACYTLRLYIGRDDYLIIYPGPKNPSFSRVLVTRSTSWSLYFQICVSTTLFFRYCRHVFFSEVTQSAL
ncbi:GSCOCG00008846001-RA-CDS [Cotesia congregata]|nr:GSCOCG00008846001-RA-CDS [Cotesia congregata]